MTVYKLGVQIALVTALLVGRVNRYIKKKWSVLKNFILWMGHRLNQLIPSPLREFIGLVAALITILTFLASFSNSCQTSTEVQIQLNWITTEQLEIHWLNLTTDGNYYLVLSDGQWFYSPRRLRGSRGITTVAPGNNIAQVVIVSAQENVFLKESIGKIDVNDNRIIEVIASKPLPAGISFAFNKKEHYR